MLMILGASGLLGNRLGLRLLERGETIRAVSRDPSRLSALVERGATAVRGDLRTGEWMPSALQGVTTLVLATHGLVPPSRDNHPGVVDGTGNRRIIDAAVQAGVEHIVFVSATSGAASPVLFGQLKYQTEQHLQRSGVSYTIVRPTVFIETHALMLLAQPLREQQPVVLLGPSTTRVNWISADDVVEFIVQSLGPDQPRNRVSVIGGPDTMSRLDVLAVIEGLLGMTARRRHIPLALLGGVKVLAGPFHPGIRYLLDMVLMEAKHPDDATWAPRTLDWTGQATVSGIVGRWARSA